MKNKICLDTGVITQACSKEIPYDISLLMNDIKKGIIEAFILSPILIEAFFHICRLKGRVFAENTIASFLNTYPVKMVNLDQTLIYKAGLLKCQYPKKLSYNDCCAIAYSLNQRLTFHTTEKELKDILPNLKIIHHSYE